MSAAATTAVTALNGLTVCGRNISAQIIQLDPGGIFYAPGTEPEQQPSLIDPMAGGGVQTAAALVPTYTLELREICEPASLADDATYELVLREVEQECSDLGEVVNVALPRPPPPPQQAPTDGDSPAAAAGDDGGVTGLTTVGSAYVTFRSARAHT